MYFVSWNRVLGSTDLLKWAAIFITGIVVYLLSVRLYRRNNTHPQLEHDHKTPRFSHRAVGDITSTTLPVSINFHFTRKCNKDCGFCFHTEKTSHVATSDEMMQGLRLLEGAGMKKINFAGGEPFLYPKILALLCKYCKIDLNLESVSIITNGTKVTQKWLQQNCDYIDVLGVSCDSFDESTNIKIGRGTGENVTQLFRVREWCRELNIKFKLNTVVCQYNWEEDMSDLVSKLDPFRWKCFQVLAVESENDASSQSTLLDRRKRNAHSFLITDHQFQVFCEKHEHLTCFVPESNELMASSYLILDEYLCFLDKGKGEEKQSPSILDVGVVKALEHIKWDETAFLKRGGLYDWSKELRNDHACSSQIPKALQF